MSLFDKIAQPEHAGRLSTATQEGTVVGWFPAVITDMNDPTGLNRVKVRADIFDDSQNLPCSNDGWAFVLEQTSGGEVGGVGTVSKKYTGAQVAVLPMLGDMTQLLVLGCIHNRQEIPSRELNRHEGLCGDISLNGICHVQDDRTGREISSMPSGLVNFSSPKGDQLTQTPGGAKSLVGHDGGISQSNKNCSSNLTPEGDVKSANAAGASFGLTSKGVVNLEDKMGAGLLLDGESKATFMGTRTPLAGAVKALERVLPDIVAKAAELIKVIELFPDNQAFKGQLEELLKELPKAQELLGQVADFGIEAIGKSLLPQAQAAIDHDTAGLKAIAEKALDTDNPVEYLKKELPPEQKIPDTLAGQLKGLSHDRPLQVQSIVSALVPGGFDSIKRAIGMGVESLLPEVNNLLTSIPQIEIGTATPEELEQYQQLISQVTQQLNIKLPNLDAEELITKYLEGGDPYRLILGTQAIAMVDQVSGLLENLSLENIADQIESLHQSVGQLLNSLDSGQRGGTINLTKDSAEVKANPDGAVMRLEGDKATIKPSQTDLAPSMEISMAQAALVGAGGSSRIFADKVSAGLATAFGGFSFGSSGGVMNAIGSFVQSVVARKGDTSGANFELAGNLLQLSHGDKRSPNHALRIDADGIWADDVNLADLSDPERFWAIYQPRIVTLIAASIPPAPTVP